MKNLFEIVVNETNEIASEHGQHFTVNNSSTEPWKDLALFWAEHPSIFPDIFYCALYHIASDRYPYDCTPSPLLSLVEDAVLHNDATLSQWKSTFAYKDAHDRIYKNNADSPFFQHWKSFILRDLAQFRFLLLTKLRLGHKSKTPLAELTGTEFNERAHALETACFYRHDCRILNAVHPAIYTDCLDDCPTETLIFSNILTHCGVDFSYRPDLFDSFWPLLRKKAMHKAYYRELFSYEDIPEDVAHLIWPTDMEKELIKQFRWLCSTKPAMWNNTYDPNDVISPENVRNSWAFQHLWDMLHAGKVKLSNKARSNLLNMSMGNHPCIIREHQKANQPVV